MPVVDTLITQTSYSKIYLREHHGQATIIKKIASLSNFINEVLLGNAVPDDFSLNILGVGFDEMPFIEFPHCPLNLEQFVRTHKGYSGYIDRANSILIGITQGIYYLNRELGIIHGDIKPKNILLDSAGEPKIIDYSGARILNEMGIRGIHMTAVWASPETIAHGNEGCIKDLFRVDVWSLGLTAYYMANGENLIKGKPPKNTKEPLKKEDNKLYKLSVLQCIVDTFGVKQEEVLGLWRGEEISHLSFVGSIVKPDEINLGEFPSWKPFVAGCLRVDPNKRISIEKALLMIEKVCGATPLSIFRASIVEHSYKVNLANIEEYKGVARAIIKMRAKLASKKKLSMRVLALAMLFYCHIRESSAMPSKIVSLCSLGLACVLKQLDAWRYLTVYLIRQEEAPCLVEATSYVIGVASHYNTYADSIAETKQNERLLLSMMLCKSFYAQRNQGLLSIALNSVRKHLEDGFELNSLEESLHKEISKVEFGEDWLIY